MTLPIRQIKGAGKCYLSLEGTVLLLHQKQAGMEQTVLIPVELVSISERSLLKGSHLIAALLCLLVPLVVGGISFGIVSAVFGEDSLYSTITSCTFATILLTGVVLFFVFLVKFLRKNKTICLTIAPEGIIVEFWKENKYSQQLSLFLGQLKQKQSFVTETISYPAQHSFGFTDEHSILPKTLGAVLLFSLPAVISAKLPLMVFALIPVAWFAYKKIIYNMQPKEYRIAMRRFLCQQWDEAATILTPLIERLPAYLPAYELLSYVYIRANRFEDALRTAAQLPDEYTEMTHSMQTDIWKFKRICERRKEPVKDNNKILTNESAGNTETQ